MKMKLTAVTGILVILLCVLLSGCGTNGSGKDASTDRASGESSQQTNAPKTLDELRRADIGVMTGTNFPEHVKEALPEANTLFYNTVADEVNALKSGKVAAVALDEPVARNVMTQDSAVTVIPEKLKALDYGFIFQKNEAGKVICDKLSEFIVKTKKDGTAESLQKKWFDSADLSAVEAPDQRDLTDKNGTIHLAMTQNPPFAFTRNETACGYDIELFTMFCREYGYALEISDVSADAILSAVQSGKYDSACCGISITEERKESMLFSEANYSGGTVLLVMKDGADQNNGSILMKIKDSFEKTFIREDRWKLFLEGIGTTMLITMLSVLFGTILGFFVFILCRKGNPVANNIADFCMWLVQGMPVVVLLMILYYIVFGQVAISGTIVSIVGFTLIFGTSVFNMIRSGVGAVDKGQTEAAYSLGYTDRQAFYKVVLPQALPHFMPTYKGEITSLIKATAIVGYVAVQDLTKMGDIVRSQTYEAFFPLIAVAIIYFIIAAILTAIVEKIEIRIDPRLRSREDILKGVTEND